MTIRDVPAFLWLALILVAIPWGAIVAARRKRAGLPAFGRAQRCRGDEPPHALSRLGAGHRPAAAGHRSDRPGSTAGRPCGNRCRIRARDGCGSPAASPRTRWSQFTLDAGAARARGLPLDAGTARLLPRDRGEFLRFVPLASAMAGSTRSSSIAASRPTTWSAGAAAPGRGRVRDRRLRPRPRLQEPGGHDARGADRPGPGGPGARDRRASPSIVAHAIMDLPGGRQHDPAGAKAGRDHS